jgi:hypothetical protein
MANTDKRDLFIINSYVRCFQPEDASSTASALNIGPPKRLSIGRGSTYVEVCILHLPDRIASISRFLSILQVVTIAVLANAAALGRQMHLPPE